MPFRGNPPQSLPTLAAPRPTPQVVKDDAYLDGEFITTVQQRGAAIIKVSVCVCACWGRKGGGGKAPPGALEGAAVWRGAGGRHAKGRAGLAAQEACMSWGCSDPGGTWPRMLAWDERAGQAW